MGRVYRPRCVYKKTDGTQVDKITDAWYVEYADATGRCIRRKAGITKEQAQDALRKAEMDVLNEKNGLPTQRAADMRVQDLLKSYLVSLRQRASVRHVYNTERDIKDLLTTIRAIYIRDLTPAAVDVYLASLAAEGYAANTINSPLISIKALLNWAVTTRRLLYNPLACVKRVKGEPVKVRRALNEDEISRLLAAAVEGPLRRQLRGRSNRPRKDGSYKRVTLKLDVQAQLACEGRNMVLIYRLMIEAGLRKNETACLRWADLNLDDGIIRLRAETTKNGKTEELPTSPGLLAALKARKSELNPKPESSVVTLTSRALRSFDDDSVAAGLALRIPLDKHGVPIPVNAEGRPVRTPHKWKFEKTDAAGRSIDLHALRHTCGTRLVANGADIKTVQSIMRHASAAFTLAVYIHKDKKRMAAAVAALPDLGAERRIPEIPIESAAS